MAVKFDKYDRYGAIHWRTSNPLALRYNPTLVSRYNSVLRQISAKAKSVLDIGCGDGRLTYLIGLKLPEARVIGIDADVTGIERARQQIDMRSAKNIEFECNQNDVLPFDEGSFDTIVMTDVIEHLILPRDMLAEVHRVLTPHGIVVVTTPNRQDGSKWDVRHEHEFDGPELKTLLSEYFEDVKVLGSWNMQIVRKGKKGWGRIYLSLLSRIGIDLLKGEAVDPSADWGQLTAVCSRPKRLIAGSRT